MSVNAKSIARLAYGYELMFSALCNIAGTSGGTTHWFTQKGQEVTSRVDPLWKLTDESNPPKPGDCLSQHEPFGKWAEDAETALAAKDAEIAALTAKMDPLVGLLTGLVAESGRDVGWGEEDSFRMGEWFEAHDLAAIEAARAALKEKADA